MRSGGGEEKNEKWRRRYLRIARKTVQLAEENGLSFDLEWLKSLTGVIRWVESNKWITDPQIRGIVNATRAVKNIVRYKKWKERRSRGKTEGSA